MDTMYIVVQFSSLVQILFSFWVLGFLGIVV